MTAARASVAPRSWTPPELDPAALYGLAGRWAGVASEFSEVSVVGVFATSLVAFGAASGRNAYVEVGATRHYANENVLLVGPSSASRKGDAINAALAVIGEADEAFSPKGDRVVSGFGSGEAVVYELRDPRRSDDEVDVLVDAGASDRRLLIREHEFAHVLDVASRDGSTLDSLIRNAWDGHRLENRTKGSKIVATDAHVSIVAAITPEEAAAKVSSVAVANGLVNRFLHVAVYRDRVEPMPQAIPLALRRSFGSEFALALAFARRRGVSPIELDAAAAEVWRAAYLAELAVPRFGAVGSATSRAEAHVLRVAILYALLDCSDVIRAVHVEAALAFWRYCEASARMVYGSGLGHPDADKLVAALLAIAPRRLNRRELHNGVFAGHATSDRLDRAIATALDAGLIDERDEPSTGGRPPTTYGARRA